MSVEDLAECHDNIGSLYFLAETVAEPFG